MSGVATRAEFCDLPVEIVCLLVRYLSARDLGSLLSTCHNLNDESVIWASWLQCKVNWMLHPDAYTRFLNDTCIDGLLSSEPTPHRSLESYFARLRARRMAIVDACCAEYSVSYDDMNEFLQLPIYESQRSSTPLELLTPQTFNVDALLFVRFVNRVCGAEKLSTSVLMQTLANASNVFYYRDNTEVVSFVQELVARTSTDVDAGGGVRWLFVTWLRPHAGQELNEEVLSRPDAVGAVYTHIQGLLWFGLYAEARRIWNLVETQKHANESAASQSDLLRDVFVRHVTHHYGCFHAFISAEISDELRNEIFRRVCTSVRRSDQLFNDWRGVRFVESFMPFDIEHAKNLCFQFTPTVRRLFVWMVDAWHRRWPRKARFTLAELCAATDWKCLQYVSESSRWRMIASNQAYIRVALPYMSVPEMTRHRTCIPTDMVRKLLAKENAGIEANKLAFFVSLLRERAASVDTHIPLAWTHIQIVFMCGYHWRSTCLRNIQALLNCMSPRLQADVTRTCLLAALARGQRPASDIVYQIQYLCFDDLCLYARLYPEDITNWCAAQLSMSQDVFVTIHLALCLARGITTHIKDLPLQSIPPTPRLLHAVHSAVDRLHPLLMRTGQPVQSVFVLRFLQTSWNWTERELGAWSALARIVRT